MTYTPFGDAGYGPGGIFVGSNGDGVLQVRDITSTVGALNVASFGGDYGFGLVRLQGSDITVDDGQDGNNNSINIGFGNDNFDAIGTVIVESGSTLTSLGRAIPGSNLGTPEEIEPQGTYGGLNIGRNADGNLIVNGEADAQSRVSILGDGNRITVGRDDGIGLLRLSGNAVFEARNADIGRNNNNDGGGAVGRVELFGEAGDSPTLHFSTAFGDSSYYSGQFAGSGTYVSFGRGSYTNNSGNNSFGELFAYGAANLIVENLNGYRASEGGATLRFAREDGSVGTGRLVGADVVVDVINNNAQNEGYAGAEVQIGREGEGHLVVEQGATVNVIGGGSNVAVGLRNVTGDEQDYTSTLEISSGGTVNVNGTVPFTGRFEGGFATVGTAGAKGDLTIIGEGSALNLESDTPRANENAAFLTVGRDGGTGTMRISAGGDLTIEGNRGTFPGLRAGQGEDGHGTIKVFGEGSSITISGNNTSEAFAGGVLSIGRDAGSYGRLDILNGADVAITTGTSGSSAGLREGSEGRINVFGAGSTLDAGDVLFVGADVDSDALNNGTPLDEATSTNGGRGRLVVKDGAALTADDVFVGTNSLFDVEGTLTGSLTSSGEIQIGGDDISTLTITGDVTVLQNSNLEFDIDNTGNADSLQIDGSLDLVRFGSFTLDLIDGNGPAIGTEIVLIDAAGGITLEPDALDSRVNTTLPNVGFTVEVKGNQLIATARETQDFAPLLIG
ncbi:MAG: hypothetical protein AAFR17_12315, partial [Pseudomonadota bacterium]